MPVRRGPPPTEGVALVSWRVLGAGRDRVSAAAALLRAAAAAGAVAVYRVTAESYPAADGPAVLLRGVAVRPKPPVGRTRRRDRPARAADAPSGTGAAADSGPCAAADGPLRRRPGIR